MLFRSRLVLPAGSGMPEHSVPGAIACTLSYGDVSAASVNWYWETSGLPSTSEDRKLVIRDGSIDDLN